MFSYCSELVSNVYYVLCICGLWVIVFDVPDVFVVASL